MQCLPSFDSYTMYCIVHTVWRDQSSNSGSISHKFWKWMITLQQILVFCFNVISFACKGENSRWRYVGEIWAVLRIFLNFEECIPSTKQLAVCHLVFLMCLALMLSLLAVAFSSSQRTGWNKFGSLCEQASVMFVYDLTDLGGCN